MCCLNHSLAPYPTQTQTEPERNQPGEVVVQELIDRFGSRKKGWPKRLLRSLEERNAALLAAICERVCFVPKDLFWPLGQAARDVLTGKYGEAWGWWVGGVGCGWMVAWVLVAGAVE